MGGGNLSAKSKIQWTEATWPPPDRTDEVELQGGMAHLLENLRNVARMANEAGLAGYQLVTAPSRVDFQASLRGRSPVRITYRKVRQ